MKKILFIIILILICGFAILCTVSVKIKSSQNYQSNVKFLNALKKCSPVIVYISNKKNTAEFETRKVDANNESYKRQVVGIENYICEVIDNGKKCNFPLSVASKLSDIGKKIYKFNSDLIWVEEMYNLYCCD